MFILNPQTFFHCCLLQIRSEIFKSQKNMRVNITKPGTSVENKFYKIMETKFYVFNKTKNT
jgi:hypothetical protein